MTFFSRNDSIKTVRSRPVSKQPHSPFSLLTALYFRGHIVGVASVAVFRSVVFSYRISNWMYTESSTYVFE